ncbi:MAG: hypothetical protein KBT04_05445 [Bacteroidales bacterium]|nr:hypothetical protein [Candidatus Colimorpha onthohippi]
MKRYLFAIIILTFALVLISFILLWCHSPWYIAIMPAIPLYFGIITGSQHFSVVRAAHKDPRTFIKTFLGLTVGTLLIHLFAMAIYMFTHLLQARAFIMGFAVCYIAYLAFETIALVHFVKSNKR